MTRALREGCEESDPVPSLKVQDNQHASAIPQVSGRKRKRPHESEDELENELKDEVNPAPAEKRPRSHSTSPATESIDPIDYWRKEGRWPKKYFEMDEDTHAYITRDPEEESMLRQILASMERPDPLEGKTSEERMKALLARPRSPSLQSSTPSDQKPREVKSMQYTRPWFPTMLEIRGCFMRSDEKGVSQESKDFCRTLFETDQEVPENSLFRDDLFKYTCQELQSRNEAKIIQDIGRLIVPSARHLAIRGAEKLKVLAESVNEGWDNALSLKDITRPQPDYAVGFGRSAFTDEQLNKLGPFVGELTETSVFMATYYMYFPLLTCEVKGGLQVADRQNAHSMTLAVRGVVELFKLVEREKELDRQILAFSVSHDDSMVYIYGHYPVIEGKKASFYCWLIRAFSFTTLDGKEKWTAYKFTKNVYDVWMPEHLKRLCSVIDQLPTNVSFELSEQSTLQFAESGLSQELQDYALSQPVADSASFQGDSQGSASRLQGATPDTSITQPPGPFRKRPATGQ